MMNELFYILLSMVFLHIVDDYYMQGILAKMKQKKWWEDIPYPMYKNDYKVALLMHAFSWTFMIMLPSFLLWGFDVPWWWFITFAANVAVHAFVDDLKANKLVINLVVDQSVHIAQIVVTWYILFRYWM